MEPSKYPILQISSGPETFVTADSFRIHVYDILAQYGIGLADVYLPYPDVEIDWNPSGTFARRWVCRVILLNPEHATLLLLRSDFSCSNP